MITAIIPVRKGSKRFPGKHMERIDGRPLIKIVTDATTQCRKIERTYVVTNDEVVAGYYDDGTKDHGLTVMNRSEYNARDESKTEDVLREVLPKIESETICLVQATNPFLTSVILTAILDHYQQSKADSLFTAVRMRRYAYQLTKTIPGETHEQGARAGIWGQTITKETWGRVPLSEMEGFFIENGSVYVFSKANFLRTGRILYGYKTIYEMEPQSLIEIDTPDDLIHARFFLEPR